MKKLYISLMMLGAVAFTSCDMDLKPYGSLDDTTAIQSANDLRQFRNQVYSTFRAASVGSYVYTTDLQLDEFNGLTSNSNRMGEFSKGELTPQTSAFSSFWGGCYGVIATCNSLVEHADRMLASEKYSETDKVAFARYKGEALFLRAYMYFYLADHFCQSYTQTDPTAEHSGMPLVTKYNPTSDPKAYPDRSSLEATFKLINDDLDAAYEEISAYEKTGVVGDKEAMNPTAYICSEAVMALQARVALVQGDYERARDKAIGVIESNKFALSAVSLPAPTNKSYASSWAKVQKEYTAMWNDDTAPEIIFQPIMSTTELGGSMAAYYLSESETSADYIPNYGTLSMYGEGDLRFDVFFKEYPSLTVEGSNYPAYVFNKYPGNPALRVDSKNNLVNMGKVLRLSEMYLVAAEAMGRLNDGTNGSKYFNEFCRYRYSNYNPSQEYSAQNLVNNVLDERQREFLGEGMRWSDLRRTGRGFTRYSDFPAETGLDYLNGVMVSLGRNLVYQPTDHRFTWPIPKDELDANPKLRSQQNPGY